MKSAATLHLMDRPWRLFVTGWYEAHRAGHNLWPVDGDFASKAAPDAMLAVYEETDRQLAHVLARIDSEAPETAVLLFALHGMEPNRAQDHFLGEILSRLNRLYLDGECATEARAAAPNLMAALRRGLPASLQYRAASLAGERVQDWVVNRALVSGLDPAATPSFAILSGGEGLIRLSVKGREAIGYFEPGSAELESYVGWLCERLGAITVAGTGEPLVDDIVRTDAEFAGERRAMLPDLILRWRPDAPAERIVSPDIGKIGVALATGRGGNHNSLAFVIPRGDAALVRDVAAIDHIAALGTVARQYFA
jgi:hypothetical protein